MYQVKWFVCSSFTEVEKSMNHFLASNPAIIPVNISVVDLNRVLLLYK